MIQEYDKEYVYRILSTLDERNWLFPQFALTKQNNEPKLLGAGGFSTVYEMYNKESRKDCYAIKVVGFQHHTMNSEEFRNTNKIQWLLSQESKYIMRILDTRELLLTLTEDGSVTAVKDVAAEAEENTENTLLLQLVLMEKLDRLIATDKFGKVDLLHKALSSEAEVLKLAFEVGQAIACAHINGCLHRDIKIENIFWDALEETYKLGDFGLAKRVENGTAETIVYTNGYGAPEIERRFGGSYNVTADIYSFGITLYLLLNELRFPGSEGYYSKTEIQYNPQFVFPVPIHASEEMAKALRKMCSYYPEDRYQSMNEVLAELAYVLECEENPISEEISELADLATETYKEYKEAEEEQEKKSERSELTRAERKAAQKYVDSVYCKKSILYFMAITVLLILLTQTLQTDASMIAEWIFYMLPAAVFVEAVLQKLKEFQLLFSAAVFIFIGLSIYTVGLTIPHIVLILCVLAGCPMLTMAGAVSTGAWMLLRYYQKWEILYILEKWDLGWLLLGGTLLVIYKYFSMRRQLNKTSYFRAFVAIYIFDKLFPLMILTGIVLFVLQKGGLFTMPDILQRLHLVRTGIVSFAGINLIVWQEGLISETD